MSGFIVLIFGAFLMLATGLLGFFILVAGPIMMVAGLFLSEPDPPSPDDPTKRYCKFCMAEVDVNLGECPECGFPSQM